MIDMNDPNWGEKFKEWLDTPEGKASLQELRDKMDAEDRAKENFAKRVKAMTVAQQDYWMCKIIKYYNSDKYIDHWYNRGIFPPYGLFESIREFIFENGVQIGETPEGSGIYQYNHWKMDCLYGQGECHHNFTYTLDEPHPYGDEYAYVVFRGNDNNVVQIVEGAWFKSYDIAKEYADKYQKGDGLEYDIVMLTLNKKEREEIEKQRF